MRSRSRGVRPPQTPYGSCTSSACSRQRARTGQCSQYCFACSSRRCRTGPRSESGGKKTSGSTVRQTPSYCHSQLSMMGLGKRLKFAIRTPLRIHGPVRDPLLQHLSCCPVTACHNRSVCRHFTISAEGCRECVVAVLHYETTPPRRARPGTLPTGNRPADAHASDLPAIRGRQTHIGPTPPFSGDAGPTLGRLCNTMTQPAVTETLRDERCARHRGDGDDALRNAFHDRSWSRAASSGDRFALARRSGTVPSPVRGTPPVSRHRGLRSRVASLRPALRNAESLPRRPVSLALGCGRVIIETEGSMVNRDTVGPSSVRIGPTTTAQGALLGSHRPHHDSTVGPSSARIGPTTTARWGPPRHALLSPARSGSPSRAR
jgi:hypothetical protein